jgi:hypothetical protein
VSSVSLCSVRYLLKVAALAFEELRLSTNTETDTKEQTVQLISLASAVTNLKIRRRAGTNCEPRRETAIVPTVAKVRTVTVPNRD